MRSCCPFTWKRYNKVDTCDSQNRQISSGCRSLTSSRNTTSLDMAAVSGWGTKSFLFQGGKRAFFIVGGTNKPDNSGLVPEGKEGERKSHTQQSKEGGREGPAKQKKNNL